MLCSVDHSIFLFVLTISSNSAENIRCFSASQDLHTASASMPTNISYHGRGPKLVSAVASSDAWYVEPFSSLVPYSDERIAIDTSFSLTVLTVWELDY